MRFNRFPFNQKAMIPGGGGGGGEDITGTGADIILHEFGRIDIGVMVTLKGCQRNAVYQVVSIDYRKGFCNVREVRGGQMVGDSIECVYNEMQIMNSSAGFDLQEKGLNDLNLEVNNLLK